MCIYIHTPMPSPLPLPSTPTQLFPSALCAHLDLRQLLKLFVKLAAAFHDPAPPPHGQRKFYQRIFCPLVTLWGMVLQRLLADPTLDNLVTNFFHGKADALRPGQNSPSQKIKSRQTASFSNARKRLPLELIKKVSSSSPRWFAKRLPADPGRAGTLCSWMAARCACLPPEIFPNPSNRIPVGTYATGPSCGWWWVFVR